MSEIGDWELTFLKEATAEDESDLPPEYCHYKDEGCELATSCLNCPFAQCIYDEPGGKQCRLKKLRNREIVRLFTSGDKRIKELTVIFGLSRRTIQRALKSTLPQSKV